MSIVEIQALEPRASESGGPARFMVTRAGGNMATTLTLTLSYAGTASRGKDYADPGLEISIPAYTTFTRFTVDPIADALIEGEETVVVNLVAKRDTYALGPRASATATIADAVSAPAAPAGAPKARVPLPPRSKAPRAERSASLTVTIEFDGSGNWKNARSGAYADLTFHRAIRYSVPMVGNYGLGSGFSAIDRREQARGFIPNFKRYLVLRPRAGLQGALSSCGRGSTTVLDRASGMEEGDPGMPPLVPFVHLVRGGGPHPSGDQSVPERDLCMNEVALDLEKKVYHLRIDGSDTHVKVTDIHNDRAMKPTRNLPLQGYDPSGALKRKLVLLDIPLGDPSKAVIDGSRTIENFNQVAGPDGSKYPLRARVRWSVKLDDGAGP